MNSRALFLEMQRVLHVVASGLLFVLGFGALVYTLACAFGAAPWLEFEAKFGDYVVPAAGQAVQVLVTLLFLSLTFFVPTTRRILRLEQSHRSFQVSMDDVARAYYMSHAADREGIFSLSREFDAVRERLAFMRDHPDLDNLEPEVMELAAQMSYQARDLADIYSDEKVQRAKTFLKQRQQEAERQQQLIVEAQHACREMREWTQQVEVEESVVASQLSQLEEMLEATLPQLGYSLGKSDETGGKIIPLSDRPAAE